MILKKPDATLRIVFMALASQAPSKSGRTQNLLSASPKSRTMSRSLAEANRGSERLAKRADQFQANHKSLRSESPRRGRCLRTLPSKRAVAELPQVRCAKGKSSFPTGLSLVQSRRAAKRKCEETGFAYTGTHAETRPHKRRAPLARQDRERESRPRPREDTGRCRSGCTPTDHNPTRWSPRVMQGEYQIAIHPQGREPQSAE